MKQTLLEELLPGVRENCLISDARYWGYYSICGLLLRLRELYRFENQIPDSGGIDRQAIAEWIGRREALWEEMQGREFLPIVAGGREFDPFDAEGINALISRHGLLYGGGYGIYLKPVFFVSDLDGVQEIDGLKVCTAGREYVRDLAIHPAMLRDRTVIARRYAANVLIREKFDEFRAMKQSVALGMAFRSYGIDAAASPEEIERVSDGELVVFVHHELGEAAESRRAGGLWTEMLANIGHRRASVFLRSVKDTLADTSDAGMLRHIIEALKTGSLAFYIASLSGFRKTLARGVEDAFRGFAETGSWKHMEAARKECYGNSRRIADGLLEGYEKDRDPGSLLAAVEGHITRMCSPHPR